MSALSTDLDTIATIFNNKLGKMSRSEMVDFLYETPNVSADALLTAHQHIRDFFRGNTGAYEHTYGVANVLFVAAIREHNASLELVSA